MLKNVEKKRIKGKKRDKRGEKNINVFYLTLE